MTSSPAVYVVVPVHNRRHYTEPFLRCLHRQTYSPITVVVFDDGSSDGTADMIRTAFPAVIILRGDGNVWWTASVNRAIRRALQDAAPADYVLVMNDDVEVDQRFVATLVQFAWTHPGALVGAPTVDLRTTDRIDDGGVRVNWWTAKHHVLNRGRRLSEFPLGHYERPSYLTGRACLIPVTALGEIGLYDEQHFVNCADTELPVRAVGHGYQLFVCYDAVVRSHVDAIAAENVSGRYTLGMIGSYLFGVKSYSRLTYRYYFARTASRGNPARFVSYLIWDMVRIIVHFTRGLRLAARPAGH